MRKKAMMAGTLGVGAVLGGAVYAANHRRHPRVIGEEVVPLTVAATPTDPAAQPARRWRRPLRRRSV